MLAHLFTYKQNYRLMIPNVINRLAERFGELKTPKRCHTGMSIETKKLFINNFFDI